MDNKHTAASLAERQLNHYLDFVNDKYPVIRIRARYKVIQLWQILYDETPQGLWE